MPVSIERETTDQEWETCERHVRLWRNAKTFDRLCELTARYIEGKLLYAPTSYGMLTGVSEETLLIQGELAAINRLGLLTFSSHPGGVFKSGRITHRQRAYVDGFVEQDVAEPFWEAMQHTNLLLRAWLPEDPILRNCSVLHLITTRRTTRSGRWDGSGFGGSDGRESAEMHIHNIDNWNAKMLLRDCVCVSVIDMNWSSTTEMFAIVASALAKATSQKVATKLEEHESQNGSPKSETSTPTTPVQKRKAKRIRSNKA